MRYPDVPWRRRTALACALTLLLLGCCAPLVAQCSNGSCGSGGGGFLRPMFGGMASAPQISSTPMRSPAELIAAGFSLHIDPATGGQYWSRAAGASADQPITTLAGCSDGSCGPGGQLRGGRNTGWNAAPRADRPQLADSSKPAPTSPAPSKPAEPPPSTTQPLDLDKLTSMLVDKLAADERFKGPKGDAGRDGVDGAPGPPGPAGKDGKDADETRIVAAVLAKIDLDAIAARVKPPTVPVASVSRHWVLVADQAASYWPRIAGELARARESYSSIDVVPDPGNVGPMPRLVLYEGSTAIQDFAGQRAVSEQLSLLARH